MTPTIWAAIFVGVPALVLVGFNLYERHQKKQKKKRRHTKLIQSDSVV